MMRVKRTTHDRRFGVLARGIGLALAGLTLVTASLGAQSLARSSSDVERIEWKGLRSLSEETLGFYLGLQVGTPLDREKLNDRIHALWRRELIDDISVTETPGTTGVVLEVVVTERPILQEIEYDGLKKLSRTDVEDRMDRERIHLREGVPFERGELVRLEAAVLEMYYEKGYRFAQVDYTFEEASPGEISVKFSVDEGDKVKIDEIDFEGNTVFTDFRLGLAMRKTRPSGPLSRLLKRDIYNPASYEEDVDRVRDLYREKGFKNVIIGEPELEVVALRPGAAELRDQKRRLRLTIPIDEGERWKFGEISVEGNEVYTDELLLRAFDRPRTAWLKASAVDKGVEAIDELYRNSGYIYSSIDVELREREDSIADVILHVDENDQYTVGRLEFDGNDRTRDRVLRREFRLHEGRVVNMGALRGSLFKLNQLGYFKLDEDNPVEFENFDSEKKTVDLRVQGEEADRTELLFGGGWSELDGFFGTFSVRTQNFLGRGETLAASIQTGRVTDRFDVSYFVPWIRDRPQSAGLQVFNRSLDYVLFGSQRQQREETGGVLTYGRSFGFFNSFRTSLSLTSLEDRIEFLDPEGNRVSRFSEFEKASLRPQWIFDSVDSRIEPTRGLRTSLSFEYAGDFLGGTVSFWRPELDFTYYRPVSRGPLRTVFAVNAEFGYLDGFETDELPLLERYYSGGSRSIRGFASRSIFLRDDNNVPIRDQFFNILGGTSFAELGLEYHVLLGGPFRMVFFVDAGGVFDPDLGVDWDFDTMRTSAGAELRLFVPVFGLPLRFIYSKNLEPQPGDRFESFQFDVGTSF